MKGTKLGREAMPLSAMPLFLERGVASVLTEPDAYAGMTRVSDYDVSERRSGNQGGSAEANERAAPGKQRAREQVYAEVVRAKSRGLTLPEYAAWAGKPGQLARYSGRFTELLHLGLIRRLTGGDGKPVLRGGAGVWVAA